MSDLPAGLGPAGGWHLKVGDHLLTSTPQLREPHPPFDSVLMAVLVSVTREGPASPPARPPWLGRPVAHLEAPLGHLEMAGPC